MLIKLFQTVVIENASKIIHAIIFVDLVLAVGCRSSGVLGTG